MSVPQRLRRLDNRVVGRPRPVQRTTAVSLAAVLFTAAAACYVGSFWVSELARAAATTGVLAGLLAGRVQEHDLTRRGLGLKAACDEDSA
jgi:hypothetical protein